MSCRRSRSLGSTDALVRGARRRLEAGVDAYAVDLLDGQPPTALGRLASPRGSAASTALVHLVGGWRGGKRIAERRLDDWDWLLEPARAHLQNTTRAFHDQLGASPGGRFALVVGGQASRADARERGLRGGEGRRRSVDAARRRLASAAPSAAATIVVVKALVDAGDARGQARTPTFTGYTDVDATWPTRSSASGTSRLDGSKCGDARMADDLTRGSTTTPARRGFARDNYAGVHPEMLAASPRPTAATQVAYGDDAYTARLPSVFCEAFRRGRRGVPRLQRHRRQRRVAAGDDCRAGTP